MDRPIRLITSAPKARWGVGGGGGGQQAGAVVELGGQGGGADVHGGPQDCEQGVQDRELPGLPLGADLAHRPVAVHRHLGVPQDAGTAGQADPRRLLSGG